MSVQHKKASVARSLLGTTLVGTFMSLACTSAGAQARADAVRVTPGDTITNTVTFTTNNGITGTASVSFTVDPLPLTGTLEAFAYAGPGSIYEDRGAGTRMFPGTFYSTNDGDGPFRRMPAPVDTSSAAARPGATLSMAGRVALADVDMVRPGMPVFFVLQDASLSLTPGTDLVTVKVVDASTGDTEFLQLAETAPGVFTGWINTQTTAIGRTDGVLSTSGQSRIIVSYLDAYGRENTLDDNILVGPFDPAGVVFDSITGAPIDGAVITLIDVATGKPATVRGEDMQSAFPARVESGADVADSGGRTYDPAIGSYRFPSVMPGRYRLAVVPPDGYAAPTEKTDEELAAIPGARRRISDASRLNPFSVAVGAPVRIDIPLDRISRGSVARDGSLSRAEPGDFIGYTVTIVPPPTGVIDIDDILPRSVRYVPGSLRVDGRAVTPTVSGDGLHLHIDDVPVGAGPEIVVTYLAQVVPGASQDAFQKSVTTVTEADTGRMAISDDHAFRLAAAFAIDEVAILGQVMSGGCGAPDIGRDMSGIRILMENGEYAVTDERGRFTFREISQQPHVLQVDQVTLPRHASLVLCNADSRSAGSAISRFVDVQPGMMARAEFHVVFDDAAAETESAIWDAMAPQNPGADPAMAFDQDWLDRMGADDTPRLLSPAPGSVPQADAISVALVRPRGTVSILMVNGEQVGRDRLDMPITNDVTGATIDRYDGVRIREGRNDITLRIMQDGEEIFAEEQQIYYATTPAFAKVITEGSSLESDGRTLPVLQIQLLGRDGYPVRIGTSVQLTIDEPHRFAGELGRISAPASSRGPGTSTTATVGADGMILVALAPVSVSGTARLQIMRGEIDAPLVITPQLSAAARPWVVVGLAEGTLGHDLVRRHMRPSGAIGNAFSGRVSLFAEGVIKGKWLMTLRLDTDGGAPRDGFSGLDPEKDYIVYGDRSWQDDAAPSRFPLYLRLKSEEAEVLIGDFDLEIDTNLISVNRKLTGLRTIRETDHFRIMAFAANTSQRTVEDRIAIDGTAGPFPLSRSDLVPHSETVTLVEIDGTDLSRTVEETTLQSGLDYAIGSDGRIFLRRSVPAFTPDGNRFVLVVNYETDEEIAAGSIAGVRAEAAISERARLGGTVVRSGNVDGAGTDVTLTGVDFTYAVSDALTFSAEWVQTRRQSAAATTTATAGEIRATYDDETSTVDVYLRAERGDVSVTPVDHRISRDIFGAKATVLLYDNRTADAEEDGLWFEGSAVAENDLTTEKMVSRGVVEVVVKDGIKNYGTGLRYALTNARGAPEPDGDNAVLYATSRLGWTAADGALTFGVGMDYPLVSRDVEADARLRLSAAYAVSDTLSVTATFDGAARDVNPAGDGATLLSFGFAKTFADDAGVVTFGALRAAGQGASGTALSFGAQRTIDVTDTMALTFAVDAQRDFGVDGVPLGASVDTPFVAGSFATLRFAARYTQDAWAAGLSAERRIDDAGGALSFRATADGALTDMWSVGGEAIVARSGPDAATIDETVLRFSAARRGDDRDPITLVQLEYTGREEDFQIVDKTMLSLFQSSYVGDAGHLNLRYGVKKTTTSFNGATASEILQLAGIEYRHDLTEAFDVGLHGAVLHSLSTGTTETSIGASVGFTPFENGYISVGYNAVGFTDDDFSQNGYTDKGAFVQFRVKFDKDTFRNAFR